MAVATYDPNSDGELVVLGDFENFPDAVIFRDRSGTQQVYNAVSGDSHVFGIADTARWTISATGTGYPTGSGGTVTQATNKSTGVTLSTLTGQITMNAASLAAAAEVTFTVTNTNVAATDVVVVHHGSAGTSGGYLAQCTAVASGSFDVTVANLSAGALAEAIVIHFAIIKGASA